MRIQGSATGSAVFAGRLALIALFIVGGLMLWRLVDVVLLVSVAALIGIGLRGLADQVQRTTRLPEPICLAAVIIGTLVAIVVVFWIFGAQLAAQYGDLAVRLPVAVHKLVAWIGATPWGRYGLQQAQLAKVDSATGAVASFVASMFGSLSKGFTYALMAIASGVFFAIEPRRYVMGLLELAPRSFRPKLEAFLVSVARDLQRWLASRLVVMVAVGVLSALGLWALGIDAPFALGITGGLLTFIPLIGALMAAIPAIVMAFAKDPIFAVWTTLLFWGVHFIEGTFITPYAQDKAVDLPPAVTIISTLAFTLLFGAWGVLFAAPMTLVLILAVRTFHIEGVLNTGASSETSG